MSAPRYLVGVQENRVQLVRQVPVRGAAAMADDQADIFAAGHAEMIKEGRHKWRSIVAPCVPPGKSLPVDCLLTPSRWAELRRCGLACLFIERGCANWPWRHGTSERLNRAPLRHRRGDQSTRTVGKAKPQLRMKTQNFTRKVILSKDVISTNLVEGKRTGAAVNSAWAMDVFRESGVRTLRRGLPRSLCSTRYWRRHYSLCLGPSMRLPFPVRTHAAPAWISQPVVYNVFSYKTGTSVARMRPVSSPARMQI